MKELSPKQQRILEAIQEFVDKHDYPPSIRQIQEACNISSTSVVDYNLRILEKHGLIRRDKEISRGIELLSPGSRRGRIAHVPLVGTIAAGQPIPVPTEETWRTYSEDTVPLPQEMLGNRENIYAVRVKGNSMIDALINDGDIVILEATNSANDGDMVAAWLKREEEATLKKIYREGPRIRLQPANQAMEPIYTDAGNVEVQGRVINVIRSLS
ncbi:MAG TPA: transcriptional repressor LexA [Dehalococcoidia bacterium]|nr:transcriptional repressor LexA [Dehalococcoidia bacterium]